MKAGLPTAVLTILRLAVLCLPLAVFVILAGPPARIAQAFGWRFARQAPILFHRLLCASLGVRVRLHGGLDPIAKQLIVANHVSWLDVPVLASLGPMSFLVKREIGDSPATRELVALQGAVYVDRQRRACLPAVNRRMVETMLGGSPLVLFAEATTGDGNRLLPFRSPHFESIRRVVCVGQQEAVIQPVYLHYSRLAGLPIVRNERPRVAWYQHDLRRSSPSLRAHRRGHLRRLLRRPDPGPCRARPQNRGEIDRNRRARPFRQGASSYFPGKRKRLHWVQANLEPLIVRIVFA
jgi:1-acyl-sn-glycerol-3-phosphate acyltransferase